MSQNLEVLHQHYKKDFYKEQIINAYSNDAMVDDYQLTATSATVLPKPEDTRD